MVEIWSWNRNRNRKRNFYKVGTGIITFSIVVTRTITFQKSEPEPSKIVTVPQHCRTGTVCNIHHFMSRIYAVLFSIGPYLLVPWYIHHLPSNAYCSRPFLNNSVLFYQCCGSGMFIPDPYFSPSWREKIDLVSCSFWSHKTTNFYYRKLSEIWVGQGFGQNFNPALGSGSRGQKNFWSRIQNPQHLILNVFRHLLRLNSESVWLSSLVHIFNKT